MLFNIPKGNAISPRYFTANMIEILSHKIAHLLTSSYLSLTRSSSSYQSLLRRTLPFENTVLEPIVNQSKSKAKQKQTKAMNTVDHLHLMILPFLPVETEEVNR